jgi:hypothetical protein
MDWLLHGDYASAPLNMPAMFLSLMLAFLGGQTMAWVYMATHSGLSYSRSFVSSLVVIPIVVSLVMSVLSNNLITAFGLMAVFAIVRFRNILRDTLDTAYVLSVIVVGMAAGTQKFTSAVLGVLVISAVLWYLSYTRFGMRHRYDLVLNLHWARPIAELVELRRLLQRHSFSTHCASQRSHDGVEGADLSYRLLLRNPERVGDLLKEVRSVEGVSRVASLKAEEESEL